MISHKSSTEFQQMADAFAAAQEQLRHAGLSFADMAAMVESLGGSREALADALQMIAAPPTYPDWRIALDALLVTLVAVCIVVLAVAPGEWWYKSQYMAVGVVALVWLLSLEDRWKRKRELW